jgi:hypothetical protein
MATLASLAPFEDDGSLASRPVSPLAPDQRLYKPLPKRSRLSTDEPAADAGQLPTWVPGKGIVVDDDHPALDTATSSTDNDVEGPPTPPVAATDPLQYHSIFSSVHSLVKDAAAATTLFSGAAAEINQPPVVDSNRRAVREGDDGEPLDGHDDDYAPVGRAAPAGQFARLAAAAGILLDDEDPRDTDDFGLDDRRGEDEYGFRRGGGGNKKKRKVPGATDGHTFASSPPASPTTGLPAPASVHGVGGLAREGETGLRANFATAMVGVVKGA